jgi:hypothetical protein
MRREQILLSVLPKVGRFSQHSEELASPRVIFLLHLNSFNHLKKVDRFSETMINSKSLSDSSTKAAVEPIQK